MTQSVRSERYDSAHDLNRIPTALIYDFDGTLVKGNLQEHSFIPSMGLKRDDFWAKVKERTRANDADEILVYMQLMLEEG